MANLSFPDSHGTVTRSGDWSSAISDTLGLVEKIPNPELVNQLAKVNIHIRSLELDKENNSYFVNSSYKEIYNKLKDVIESHTDILHGIPDPPPISKEVLQELNKIKPKNNTTEAVFQQYFNNVIAKLLPQKTNLKFVSGKPQDRFSIPDNSLKVGPVVVTPFELKSKDKDSDLGQLLSYMKRTHDSRNLSLEKSDTVFGVYVTPTVTTVIQFVYTPGKAMKVYRQIFAPVTNTTGSGIWAIYTLVNANYTDLGHPSVPPFVRIAESRELPVLTSLHTGHRTAVYLHEHGDEGVAVKVATEPDLRVLARIEREVAVLRLLAMENNSHIQRLHPLLSPLATIAVVSYFAGTSLTDLITNSPFLAACIVQACEGLAGAQEVGFCHRDLHPGNILVDKDDNLTIVDWELAVRHNGDCRNVTGALAFTSTRILQGLPQLNGFKYTFHDDLESLAYTQFTKTKKLPVII